MMQSRTHTCGELRLSDAGKTVTIVGWLENVREVGSNFAFCVLRGRGWKRFLPALLAAVVVMAAAFGMSRANVMFKQILPNVMTPIIVSTTTNVAYFILQEASLSFIGLGVADSTPTWGNILNAAKNLQVVQNQWWIWVFPGLAISLFVLAINFFGDGLRDVLDPYMKNQ